MKLYLLRPKEPYGNEELKEDNPWNPWYDKVFGFVIRTESELRAREMADGLAQEENILHNWGKEPWSTERHPWLDSKYSTCVELTDKGKEEVVIADIKMA